MTAARRRGDLAELDVAGPYLDDIYRQPDSLSAIARIFVEQERAVLTSVRELFWRGEHRLIVFTGMGASLFAAQAVVPSLEKIGVRAVAADASELLHYGIPSLAGKVAVVIISQSGESAEVRGLVKALKGRVDLMGVVRDTDSYLAAAADRVVTIPVAADDGVAINTYTGTIAVLLLVSHVLAGGVVEQAAGSLERSVEGVRKVLDRGVPLGERIASLINPHSVVHFVGRGPSLASAVESALLFKEGAKFQAEGLSAGQIRHGSVEVIEEGHVTVLFAPQGPTFDLNRRLSEELASYGSKVAVISNSRSTAFPTAHTFIHVTYPDEAYAPLVEIIPVQLAVQALATRLGRTPGQFRNTTPVIRGE